MPQMRFIHIGRPLRPVDWIMVFLILALIAGVPVTAFGRAFYTGWGATDDRAGVPQHPFRRNVDEIFAGTCLRATRYRDPFRNIAAIFDEPKVHDYGEDHWADKSYGATDPEGHHWWFTQRVRDPKN